MTPFLIDNQKRRRYIVVFILLLMVSFALGYASGFYMGILDKAEMPAGSNITSESPESLLQDEQSPEVMEKNDAAPQPEVKSEVSPPAKTGKNAVTEPSPKITKSTPVPAPVNQAKVTNSPADTHKQDSAKPISQKPEPIRPIAVAAKPKEPEQVPETQKVGARSDEPQLEDTRSISMVSNGNTVVNQESQRMFSVQVGVFANQENAMNLVDELKNGGFDAYLDDFTSSSGEVKYNVRFGRESDRNLIQQQLSKYKQKFSTSAYIIISK